MLKADVVYVAGFSSLDYMRPFFKKERKFRVKSMCPF